MIREFVISIRCHKNHRFGKSHVKSVSVIKGMLPSDLILKLTTIDLIICCY